jgi:FSR family fosmidomycin resistance protein-like MFS transporter
MVVKQRPFFGILAAISVCHALNDLNPSVLQASYPVVKATYHLDFSQIGLITLIYQITASLLQPLVGMYTDRRPTPWSLPVGMAFMSGGMLLLSQAATYPIVLMSSALIGLGSSIFHPESSRLARLASGGQHGLAQSLFQLGGNSGVALGPVMAALLIAPHGPSSFAWFCVAGLCGIAISSRVGRWYRVHVKPRISSTSELGVADDDGLSRRRVAFAICILIALIFSKYFYLASISTFFTFYLVSRFHIALRSAQMCLFAFMGATALGTLIGGPVGDRIGRKAVIWGSILGVLPFTLALPYVSLAWTIALAVAIGLVLSSAFSAILVYAQELVPGRIGMISGLFFGLAFGMAGIGAAVLGRVADATSVFFVYRMCAFLPAIGLLAAFLPES